MNLPKKQHKKQHTEQATKIRRSTNTYIDRVSERKKVFPPRLQSIVNKLMQLKRLCGGDFGLAYMPAKIEELPIYTFESKPDMSSIYEQDERANVNEVIYYDSEDMFDIFQEGTVKFPTIEEIKGANGILVANASEGNITYTENN